MNLSFCLYILNPGIMGGYHHTQQSANVLKDLKFGFYDYWKITVVWDFFTDIKLDPMDGMEYEKYYRLGRVFTILP